MLAFEGAFFEGLLCLQRPTAVHHTRTTKWVYYQPLRHLILSTFQLCVLA